MCQSGGVAGGCTCEEPAALWDEPALGPWKHSPSNVGVMVLRPERIDVIGLDRGDRPRPSTQRLVAMTAMGPRSESPGEGRRETKGETRSTNAPHDAPCRGASFRYTMLHPHAGLDSFRSIRISRLALSQRFTICVTVTVTSRPKDHPATAPLRRLFRSEKTSNHARSRGHVQRKRQARDPVAVTVIPMTIFDLIPALLG